MSSTYKLTGGQRDGQGGLFQNATQIAAGIIRQAIFDGTIPQGVKLREGKLAAELGISRTPIREALLVLQTEGFLVTSPNRGSMVREYSIEEIINLYDTRAVLEAFAASRAARSITKEQIRALDESCQRFASLIDSNDAINSNDVIRLVHENSTFHHTILEVASNGTLNHVVESLERLPLIYRSYYWYSNQGRLIALHYHEQITRALEQGDTVRVDGLMKEHIFEARDTLIRQMRNVSTTTN